MNSVDPTKIPIQFDPLKQRMVGTAYHGNTPFDVPFISNIEDNLWQGGCQDGLILPDNIDFVLSLYPWEKYTITNGAERKEVETYDSTIQGFQQVDELAQLIVDKLAEGKTVLVHCQAGLNRSSLVAARALMLQGRTADEAIGLLRSKRSPACLCNASFEKHLRSL